MHTATITDTRSPAQICRSNGWPVGTRLVGDEGYGPTVIEITAVGVEQILARTISHNGEPTDGREGTWTLSAREWRPVDEAPPSPHQPPAPANTRMREWLRHGGTSPRWVWHVFALWECVCHARFRTGNELTRHQLSCRDDRASHGQG